MLRVTLRHFAGGNEDKHDYFRASALAGFLLLLQGGSYDLDDAHYLHER